MSPTDPILEKLDRIERALAKILTQEKPSKLLLSQREAAKLLGIGRDTLAELIGLKKLRTTKVNGQPRIPRSEVERLAEQGIDTTTSSHRQPLARRASNQEAVAAILAFKVR